MIDESPRTRRMPAVSPRHDPLRRDLLRRGFAGGVAARVAAVPGAWSLHGAVHAQSAPVAQARPAGAPAEPLTGLVAFSSMAPGAALPAPWHEQTVRNIRPNRVSLVPDGGRTVLQFQSDASASSVFHPVGGALARAKRLRWRWKASAYPLDRWFAQKRGDDFAARVYVLYDYPANRVPLAQRMLLGAARALYDPELPAAALCYLLDPRAARDTMIESPYTSRVRMIVVRPGGTTDRWWDEERDLSADFARAFGSEHGPGTASIRAIVIAADTDQSGGTLTTRFGDLALEPD